MTESAEAQIISPVRPTSERDTIQGTSDRQPNFVRKIIPKRWWGRGVKNSNAERQSANEVQKNNYFAECVQGSPELWGEVGQRVLDLHTKVFGDIYADNNSSLKTKSLLKEDAESLEVDLSSSDTTVVLLHDSATNEIVGFTYAYPLNSKPLTEQVEQKAANTFGDAAYAEMRNASTEVGITLIDEAHRGKGGWTKMMNELDKHVLGKYRYMVRCVRRADNYSKKVQARYTGEGSPGTIIYKDKLNSVSGPQDYFIVRLPEK